MHIIGLCDHRESELQVMKEELDKLQHKQQRSAGEGREAVPLTPTSITPNGNLICMILCMCNVLHRINGDLEYMCIYLCISF